jgi:ABC-2 type transport system permease protein
MRTLLKMSWTEFKLFLREPIGAFFALVFPLMLLFIFGSIYGNDPNPFFGGRGSMDITTPGYIAMLVGTTGFLSSPITLSLYRERGILRRYRVTPLNPLVVIGAQVVVNLAITTLGIALLTVAAHFVYNVAMPEAPVALVLAFLLSSFSVLSVGFVLGSLLPTARTTQIVGMALFYPMLFLGGGGMPRQLLPESMQRVSEFLPLTHVNILISDLWAGEGWSLVSVLVLAAMLAVGLVVSARTFRWE